MNKTLIQEVKESKEILTIDNSISYLKQFLEGYDNKLSSAQTSDMRALIKLFYTVESLYNIDHEHSFMPPSLQKMAKYKS